MYESLLDILGVESVAAPVLLGEPVVDPQLAEIAGARILLVDDNHINQEVACEFLADAGMEVVVAGNGQECLDTLAGECFDLVFMDIQMPVMDGLEATRRIRSQAAYASLPIIAMTAHAMTGDRDKSLAAGMNDHITKPIDSGALHKVLKRWLRHRAESALISRSQPKARPPGEIAVLPELPGINRSEALKVLNHKDELRYTAHHAASVGRGRALEGDRREGAYGQGRLQLYRFV
jgi:two-component system sensor histidine kinase/response regulator